MKATLYTLLIIFSVAAVFIGICKLKDYREWKSFDDKMYWAVFYKPASNGSNGIYLYSDNTFFADVPDGVFSGTYRLRGDKLTLLYSGKRAISEAYQFDTPDCSSCKLIRTMPSIDTFFFERRTGQLGN